MKQKGKQVTVYILLDNETAYLWGGYLYAAARDVTETAERVRANIACFVRFLNVEKFSPTFFHRR